MSEKQTEEITAESLPNNRVKTPTVLQMEAVECGAAALKIILGYYNRIEPLEKLRVECGVSRDGSKASNVLRAARKYGLEAKGFKYELDGLMEIKPPMILFWNFNHFLVLEGYKNGKVYLSDPATGPRVVSFEELDASFSGVVLTFKPGVDFKPGGTKPSMFSALNRRLQASQLALLFVVLCGLLLVIPGLVIPTFTRIFIDDVLISGKGDIIQPLLIGMGITALLRMMLTGLQEHYLLRLQSKLSLVGASQFFHHILRLPVQYFSQRYGGEIGSRVLINNKIATMISGKLATTLIDSVMVVFFAVLMFQYDVVLTLVCISLALINVVVLKLVSRRRVDASRRLLQEEGKLTGTAMGGLKMIETLKATGAETEFFSRWAGYQAKTLKAEQELGIISEYVSSIPPLVTTLTTTTILVLGGLRVMDGHLTVGMLVAFQSLMTSFSGPINNFMSFGGDLQELEGDMNRIDDVLQYPQDEKYTQKREKILEFEYTIKLSGKIELKDITFGYSPLESPLIEDFNLKVMPGQRVALVGGSGSGKSTIAKMVTGLYRPWKGEILFDDVEREKISPQLLSNSIAMVDQDIFLFSGSIRDNLSMWDTTMPDINITSGSKDAAIDEVIQTRPGGFKGEVDEGGGNFSGGQAQRLEIARSLVGSPSIVVLDEATSALDSNTEKIIDDNLRRRGCTCLIIAHRLSTIRDSDLIIVMDKGKIVQQGTHEELKNVDGLYAKLMQE